jgi:hypothetical protein
MRWVSTVTVGLTLLLLAPAPLQAAGRVELVLVATTPDAPLAFQAWGKVLDDAGIKNVTLRTARGADQLGIDVRGTEQSPIYVVTGVVHSRDELRLSTGRFRRSDVGRLKQWLDDLAQRGTGGEPQQQGAFGLSAAQFATVREDLAGPLTFSTAGMSRRDVLQRIGRERLTPLKLDAGAAEALAAEQVAEDLIGLSSGTALAYVLRPMGYCMVPRAQGTEAVCLVTRTRPELEIWPVGWESDKSRRDVAPALFEFHNVNVQGVTAEVTIQAIAKRLKVPGLVDHNALARHGIDPSQIVVSHPQSRTTYGLALKKLLFQARMKYEIRIDEAGQPFLWFTTIKPV